MRVLVWVAEATWPACVAAVQEQCPPDAEVTLLHVVDDAVPAAAHGALAGLLGRSASRADPGSAWEEAAAEAGREVLEAAAERLGRESSLAQRHGRVEREVVAAAADVDLLVLARDGDRSRLGPHSLGHATRFVVDHAPCAVLLVWPGEAPGLGSVPPPPH